MFKFCFEVHNFINLFIITTIDTGNYWAFQLLQTFSCQSPTLPACKHNTKIFCCMTLWMADIMKFHKVFHQSRDKIQQDNFILWHCSSSSVKTTHVQNSKGGLTFIINTIFVVRLTYRFSDSCMSKFRSSRLHLAKSLKFCVFNSRAHRIFCLFDDMMAKSWITFCWNFINERSRPNLIICFVFVTHIIIIIGTTALDEPWPPSATVAIS